jgi:hypothetical protein
MPGDHVFRRPAGTRSGPFTARRVEGGLPSAAGEFDEIEIADVQGLSDALAGKAASTHTHPQSDITGLTAALAGKAPTIHTHTPASLGAAEVQASQWPGKIRVVSGTSAWHVDATLVSNTPASLSISPGDATVSLSWDSNGNDSVDVYRSETVDFADAVLVGSGTAAFTDTSVANGTTYNYWVVGITGSTYSEPSDMLSTTPSA